MNSPNLSAGLSIWRALNRLPKGPRLFDLLVNIVVPYTRTASARMEIIQPGYGKASFKNRRKVRNHLGSVHAAALINFGEQVSGIPFATSWPPGVSGIVTRLGGEFHKKAIGNLVAESHCPCPEFEESITHEVQTSIYNESGELVATITSEWRLRKDRTRK